MIHSGPPGQRELPSFAEQLRRYRVEAGLTQEELAERAGISARGLSDLERGLRSTPYRDTIRRLADALHLTDPERATLTTAVHRPIGVTASGLANEPSLPTLPVPRTRLVGREREVAEVQGLLGTTSLLTLVGAGGIGKTRLALQVAAEVRDRNGGAVALIELAALASAELVPQAVATGLGITEQPHRSLVDVLGEALRSQRLLLVLDNCEHLISECARLADHLLGICPDLTLLATSREPLGIAGETAWRVPSLSVPASLTNLSMEHVAGYEAVRLFVQRAAAADAAFGLTERNAPAVARLCRRLDGIPLALELAAARVTVLSVEQIAERLDGALRLLTSGSRVAPARQQTLRATLDWSYGLLTDREQRLFERLSVFAGGWTVEAAEAVCTEPASGGEDVLELLANLVDKSLVEGELSDGSMRYRLLETLRQYGQERLIDRGDADVLADRHAQFYVTLAERAEPEFYSHAALTALSRLEQEHDNCRKALRWLVDRLDAEDTQRLAGAMGRFWFFRGYVAESAAWLRQALALPGGDQPTAGRAKCLYGLGSLALSQGDFDAMERAMHEALALWRALRNACEEGFTLFSLGLAARLRADYPSARAFLEQGVEVSRAADCGAAETNNLFALAELAYEEGNDIEARGRAEAALARASGLEWTRAAAVARTVLGRVSWRRGDTAAARELLEGSLADLRELGPRFLWVVQTLTDLGELAIEQGDLSQAHARLAESLITTAELRDRFGIARNLDGFAQLAAANGQPRVSLCLAGAAAALRGAIGVPRTPTNSAALERCLTSVRAALADDTADVAWAEGAALTLDQAVAYALAPI